MSKALDILRRLASGDNRGDFFISNELLKEIQELLAQPEQEPFIFKDRKLTGSLIVHDDMYKKGYARAEVDLKREPLTGIEISQGFQTNDDATHAYSYWAGIDFAEQQHGIGGGE